MQGGHHGTALPLGGLSSCAVTKGVFDGKPECVCVCDRPGTMPMAMGEAQAAVSDRPGPVYICARHGPSDKPCTRPRKPLFRS